MTINISVLMITKNAQETIEKSLKSIEGLADEIVIIDDYSSDKTIDITKKYKAKIYLHKEYDLGKQKAYGIKKCHGEWILILDSDEELSNNLKKEIKDLINSNKQIKYTGFFISYQCFFLGKQLKYGGENYKKLVFFKKDGAEIKPALVHEEVKIKIGKIGELQSKICHYSYRSLSQMYKKFTSYAIREAKQKLKKGENSSIKKIFLYPIHMFWARFIKDKGYKDGLFRIPLDLGFAYMEFLTYFLMLFVKHLC